MENNEKQIPSENGAVRQGGKKPYHKHHHRHRYGAKQGDKPAQEAVGGNTAENATENTPKPHRAQPNNNHKPRFERPRSNEDTAPEQSVQDIEAGNTPTEENSSEHRHDNHGKRRRNDRRRGDRRQNNQREADTSESVKIIEETEYTDEALQVSEYVTTAGSLDAEVVEELNSVSAAEADNLCLDEAEPEIDIPLEKYDIVGIRFKVGGKIYYFDPGAFVLTKGDAVIVETSRGLEYGICEISNKTVTEREVVLPLRSVVKIATPEDTARHEANLVKEKEAFVICSQKILDHNLGMKLIDVEYAFDGSKLLFYFTADGRVDFRELVKDLASVFRTRIELRQIGIRDETKLLGGIGICGRPFCCKTFLSDFVQVSIKMAKEQNLSLNSVKISGACGRLMCCLRYEYDVYQEEIKKTPKVDQIVSTPDGDGTVIEVQPLAGLVRVRFGTKADMITPKVYHRDEVTVIGGKGVKPKETAIQ